MENVQKISLDILNNMTYGQVYSKQYDKGRILKIKLVEDGSPLDLTDAIVTFKAKKPDNTVVYNNCIVDAENSEITVELTEQLTVLPGKIPFEIEISNKSKKITRVKLDKVSMGNTSISILNQLQQILIPTGSSSIPYSFCSDVKMTNVTGEYGDGVPPYLTLKTGSANKNYSTNEIVPSTIKFKDVVIYNPYCDVNNFSCDIEYIGTTIVKTVSGTLKIEKAIVQNDDIESTSEFSALQVALSNLAVANAEAKVYYKEMQAISGVKSSATEPTDKNISIWIKTSGISDIEIPEIKDDETNLTDTWSSQKISEMVNSGGSTIDSEELNTALAEILI